MGRKLPGMTLGQLLVVEVLHGFFRRLVISVYVYICINFEVHDILCGILEVYDAICL